MRIKIRWPDLFAMLALTASAVVMIALFFYSIPVG